MKREREDEEVEEITKRQRLEDGEVEAEESDCPPEEEDSLSDVERSLEGAVASLANLPGKQMQK